MVDPNRKINRLADRDVDFLEECETEFALRYTEDDAEFMAHCSKPVPEPPMVENWDVGGNYGGAYQNNRFNGQRRGGWQRREGGGYQNRDRGGFRGRQRYEGYQHRQRQDLSPNRDRPDHRRNRYEPYQRRQRGGGGGQQDQSMPPMRVHRDYSNFVPASKD